MEIAATISIVNKNEPAPPTFRSNTQLIHWSIITLQFVDEDFIITIKPQGNIFKIIDNVRKYEKHGINYGFLRIGFHHPKQDLLVNCAPAKLKMFFRAIEIIINHQRAWDQELLEPNCVLPTNRLRRCSKVYGKKVNIQDDHSLQETIVYFILNPAYYRIAFKLYLDGLKLESIDNKVLALAFLSEVSFENNCLMEIPEEMGSMPSLKTLKLAHNHLGCATNWKWLTSPIIKEKLEVLDLASNKLTKVSEYIIHLRGLQSLNLFDNCIQELPMSIGNLKNLKYLNVSCNKLNFLPGSIKNLNLFRLYVTKNNFCEGFQLFVKKDLKLTEADFKVKTLFQAAAESTVRTTEYYRYDNILPDRVADYLHCRIKYCYCGLPMFDDNIEHFYHKLKVDKLPCLSHSDTEIYFVPLAIYICSYKCYIEFKQEKSHLTGGNSDN